MEKIKTFLKENQAKLALFIGLILVSALSFEAGYLKGSGSQNQPISVENVSKSTECSAEPSLASKSTISSSLGTIEPKDDLNASQQAGCTFVGSKNSTKYHLPTCSNAKRIKPENLICFKNAEEATARGYSASQDCIK